MDDFPVPGRNVEMVKTVAHRVGLAVCVELKREKSDNGVRLVKCACCKHLSTPPSKRAAQPNRKSSGQWTMLACAGINFEKLGTFAGPADGTEIQAIPRVSQDFCARG